MSDRLAPLPSLHLKGGLGSVGGDDGALLERSGISGRSNPLAAPVQWVLSDDRATGWAMYSPAYEGPVGPRARRLRGRRVRRPAGIRADTVGHRRVHRHAHGEDAAPDAAGAANRLRGGRDRVEGRKIFVWGTATCEGTLLAEAEIVFIAPRDGVRPR